MENNNPKTENFHAGGFLYNPETREVLLMLRDGNTPHNPHKWAFFGGLSENGEAPREACAREWREELGIDVKPEELILICDYLNTEHGRWRYSFYKESTLKKSEMTLGEGADFDWVSLDTVFDLDLSTFTRKDLKVFLEKL